MANIALFKPVHAWNIFDPHRVEYATDGSLYNAIAIKGSWFVLDLLDVYTITGVEVFTLRNNFSIHRTDQMRIGFLKDYSEEFNCIDDCGRLPNHVEPFSSFQVKCKEPLVISRFIFACSPFKTSNEFGCSEFEVFGTLEVYNVFQYIGCFESNSFRTHKELSITSCIKSCKFDPMAGIQGDDCSCITEAINPISTLKCNIPCKNAGSNCGGKNHYSIFKTIKCIDENNKKNSECQIEDCSQNPTICGNFKCNKVFLGNKYIGECRCEKIFYWSTCDSPYAYEKLGYDPRMWDEYQDNEITNNFDYMSFQPSIHFFGSIIFYFNFIHQIFFYAFLNFILKLQ